MSASSLPALLHHGAEGGEAAADHLAEQAGIQHDAALLMDLGAKAAITGTDWLGLVLISFVLPAVLTWLIAIPLRKWGWIKDGDLKLDL